MHLHVAVLTEPGKLAALPPLVSGVLAGAPPRTQRSDGQVALRSTTPTVPPVSDRSGRERHERR